MIGFYGGTFNPIHFGHLNLAIALMEAHGLEEVWFSPAFISPHRQTEKPIWIEHRLKMVELGIQDIPQFKLIDIESRRQEPSFTVDTLQELISTEKKKKFCLLLGEDSIEGFFRWKEPEKIVDLVPLFIGSRTGSPHHLEGNPKICEAIRKGMTSTRRMDISATEIRKRVPLGLYCGHLIPQKVLDYILENHLYL